MKRFSDISKSDNLCGTKVNISELFGKEIVILNYRKLEHSKIKNNDFCLQIQFKYSENSNDLYIVFTSSTVILKQLECVSSDMLPFLATIQYKNNYYSLK